MPKFIKIKSVTIYSIVLVNLAITLSCVHEHCLQKFEGRLTSNSAQTFRVKISPLEGPYLNPSFKDTVFTDRYGYYVMSKMMVDPQQPCTQDCDQIRFFKVSIVVYDSAMISILKDTTFTCSQYSYHEEFITLPTITIP